MFAWIVQCWWCTVFEEQVLWDVTLCHCMSGSQHFEGSHSSSRSGHRDPSSKCWELLALKCSLSFQKTRWSASPSQEPQLSQISFCHFFSWSLSGNSVILTWMLSCILYRMEQKHSVWQTNYSCTMAKIMPRDWTFYSNLRTHHRNSSIWIS